MREHFSFSMQESTTGAVTDFLEREGYQCFHSIKLLSYLAGALQRYEEEGVVLNPKVLLCNNVGNISRYLPGGMALAVGEVEFNGDSGKQILKHCATLSRSGWTIFIERNAKENMAKFGVLSFLESPTSISLREMVTLDRDSSLDSSDMAVLIEQADPKTILFSGSRGNTLRIAFSTTRKLKNEIDDINKFVDKCCASVATDEFKSYFCSVLVKCLNDSHGTILACLPEGKVTDISGMSDAVLINPPLDMASAFLAYRNLRSADSILELQRAEALLNGIFQSDGIVVFNAKGAVTAYRVFYRDIGTATGARKKANSKVISTTPILGGARRRAFEGLKSLVGNKLHGILFRSQDGITEFEGV